MSGKEPKRYTPPEPDPSPTPVLTEEAESAKKKVRKKARKGRQANILAGRMMTEHKQILKTKVGE